MPYKPIYTITDEILKKVAKVAELTGNLTTDSRLKRDLKLRRKNRILTIHGSLSIEQNTLTIEQVTAVLDGKTVIAPPKDIREVKNAFEIYENTELIDPYNIGDFLKAHGVMMRGLVENAGSFRDKNVGVVDSESGEIIHLGTLPEYVPDLMRELFEWMKNNEVHELIKSCIFHYELEVIHPFIDGNGRMGRLWHTLILSKWNPVFLVFLI